MIKLRSSGIKLVLITSDTVENAWIVLEKLNLKDKFDNVIGGDSGYGEKKHGGPAKEACKEMKVASRSVLAIGDAPMDYEMALNSDLQGCILVSSGQIELDELKNISPYSVNSLSEINIKNK